MVTIPRRLCADSHRRQHPNLAAIYRRTIEALELALQDPEVSSATAEALRNLIDAVILYPEEGRGQLRLELRGDLAAFLYMADPAQASGSTPNKARTKSGAGLFVLVLCHQWLRGARNHRELTLRPIANSGYWSPLGLNTRPHFSQVDTAGHADITPVERSGGGQTTRSSHQHDNDTLPHCAGEL
jgi:hypothetical protein